LIATIIGVAAGGLSAVRLGLTKTLVIGAIVGPGSNLAFAALAIWGSSDLGFAVAMSVDNFSSAFAGTALIGYMSSLTSLGYVATQYALLSSFYALLGKFIKGFSGALVDSLAVSYGQMPAYAIFFTITALVGIPAVVLCLILIATNKKQMTTI
jgi:MFS transporter, PAT family, beta-lactamase induction signal transducer AmpG